jgi:hypothetical protein
MISKRIRIKVCKRKVMGEGGSPRVRMSFNK